MPSAVVFCRSIGGGVALEGPFVDADLRHGRLGKSWGHYRIDGGLIL